MVRLFEQEFDEPWHHFEFTNLLPSGIVRDLKLISPSLFHVEHTDDDDRMGNYDEKNLRYYRDLPKYMTTLFTNKYIAHQIEQKLNVQVKYVEFTLVDIFGPRDVFLHCDDIDKTVTVQVYLTDQPDDNLGTWYYDKNKQLKKKLKYRDNCGHVFAPEQNKTWHSLPEVKTDMCRRSLLINYIKSPTEWAVA
jgi:hypothetical protein